MQGFLFPSNAVLTKDQKLLPLAETLQALVREIHSERERKQPGDIAGGGGGNEREIVWGEVTCQKDLLKCVDA